MTYLSTLDVLTELGAVVQAKCTDLSVPLITKGAQYPSQDVPDFVLYDFLQQEQMPSGKAHYYSEFMFQIICYSLPSNLRSDSKLFRHYELSEQFVDLLQRKEFYPVNKNACIQIREPKIAALDLRSLKAYSPQIDIDTPPMHIMCVVLLFPGVYYAIN